jgi:hypothetical protein
MALVIIAAVMVLSAFLDAPLEDPANPGLSPNPTKAPWYFAGLQEMLLHMHPVFSVFVIPSICVGSMLLLPYVIRSSDTAGIWFASGKGRRMAVIAGLAAVLITPLLILIDEYALQSNSLWPNVPPVITNGLVPFVSVTAMITVFLLVLKRRFSVTGREAFQTLFVFFVAAFVVMTATGVWFRGLGMKLMWPWQ